MANPKLSTTSTILPGLLNFDFYPSILGFQFDSQDEIKDFVVRNCLLLKFLNWSAVTHCYKYPRFLGEPGRGSSLVFKNLQNEAISSNMAASMVDALQFL